MGKNKKTYENCIAENVKQYRLDDLLSKERVRNAFLVPAEALGIQILITCRHGEEFLATPGYQDYKVDVAKQPGDKLRVENRTLGHVYADFAKADEKYAETARYWYQAMLKLLTDLLCETYLRKEAENYISERGAVSGMERQQDRMDSLTGVYNKIYFQNRMKVIERAEVVPVALIQANINDTKFFYDTYGEEVGNRLLCIVADTLKQYAKKEYIIGRCNVDVFQILIPLPEEGEAETYCEDVKKAVWEKEDAVLAPSVAMGIVYITNVEEDFENKISDVEFEMLSDKLSIKSRPGYEERKNKGLKQQ